MLSEVKLRNTTCATQCEETSRSIYGASFDTVGAHTRDTLKSTYFVERGMRL